MADPAPEKKPFDERAALEEIERARKEIERYQSERKAIDEEFERFIASFQKPAPPRPPGPPAVPRPTVPPVAFDPSVLDESPQGPAAPLPVPESLVTKPVPLPLPRPPSSARIPLLIGLVVIVLAAGGYLTWTLTQSAVEPSPGASTPPPAPVTDPTAAQEPAPAATPAPPPAQASPYESVITTTRVVWVRVISDDVPVVERELPADARVAFTARRTIVIRAGDGGAVRLTIGGVDQGPLGRGGEPVTRRFTVPR